VLSNEFHTLDGTCASLVPSGPGYSDVSIENQVCSTTGSIAGRSTVNGNQYLSISYGFSYSNLWRDFGIMCAFAAAFFVGLLVFTEMVTGSAHETSVTLFKRGSRADVVQDAQKAIGPNDEEKAAPSGGEADGQATQTREGAVQETKEVLKEQEPMRDVFTWQHLNYEVPVQGGRRKLLEDVSGYVVPGKLTALMGESGAGKVSFVYRLYHLYSY
jgi:ATP-binding cassette, subfamily G (WHITE), member 2, SNQ2